MKRKKTLIALIVVISILGLFATIIAIVTKSRTYATDTCPSCGEPLDDPIYTAAEGVDFHGVVCRNCHYPIDGSEPHEDINPKDGICDKCEIAIPSSGGGGGTPVYGSCTHIAGWDFRQNPNTSNTHKVYCWNPTCPRYQQEQAEETCTPGSWQQEGTQDVLKCEKCGRLMDTRTHESGGGGETGDTCPPHIWNYDSFRHFCSRCNLIGSHVDENGDGICDSGCGYRFPGESTCEHKNTRYYATSTQHQLRCDDCGTVLTDWESHTDTNGDGKCDVCTYEYSGGGGDDPGEHTHQYGSYQIRKQPTCTEAGEMRYVCTVPGCGNEKIEPIPALGHAWGTATVTKEATCTEAGTKTKTCSRCQATDTERIEALGHDFTGTETITKQPTCGTAGTKTIKCSRCDQTKTEDIPATGEHNITSYIDKKNGKHVGKCSVCKKEISSTLEPHTLDENGKCTKCDFERVKDNGDGTHTITDPETGVAGDPEPCQYGSWKTTKAATCTEKGTRERTCSICGHKDVGEIAAKGHDFTGTETVTKEPTCGAKGTKTIKCSRCDETQTEDIPATGKHNITSYIDKKNGKHIGKCSVCKKEISSTLEAHTLDKDGNCTKCDFKGIKDDGDEDHIITDPETGEETREPHTYGAWKDKKDGTHERVCTKCGHKQTEAHTLDSDGNCTKCDFKGAKDDGDEYHIITDPETGKETREPHTYGTWKDKKDGTHERVCTKCGHKQTEAHALDSDGNCTKCDFKGVKDDGDDGHTIIDPETGKETKEPHTYGTWKDKKDGTHERVCTKCGHKQTEAHTLDSDGKCTKCDFKGVKDDGDDGHTIIDPETGKETKEPHTYGAWKDNKNGKHERVCTKCGHKQTERHTLDLSGKCTKCDFVKAEDDGDDGHTITDPETGKETKEPHTYGDWEDNKDGTHSKICSKCLHEIKEKHDIDANGDCKKCDFKKIKNNGDGTHTITDPETGKETKENHRYEWKDNKDGTHTGECTVCGDKVTEQHTVDGNNNCTKCNYKKETGTGSGGGSGSGSGSGSGNGSGSGSGTASGILPNTGKETIIIGIAVFTLLVGIGIFKNRQYKDI